MIISRIYVCWFVGWLTDISSEYIEKIAAFIKKFTKLNELKTMLTKSSTATSSGSDSPSDSASVSHSSSFGEDISSSKSSGS